MRELKIRNGDYVAGGSGGVAHAEGREALIERALFRLTARRGAFPFWEALGSKLGELGSVSPAKRQSAAAQAAAEALEEESLQVEEAALAGDALTLRLCCEDETLALSMKVK